MVYMLTRACVKYMYHSVYDQPGMCEVTVPWYTCSPGSVCECYLYHCVHGRPGMCVSARCIMVYIITRACV